MVTAVDVKSGYGQKKAKPYNSIIPYLKAKQIHVEHNPEVKGMQDAKPRLERLIESFMEQTAREIEGGRL